MAVGMYILIHVARLSKYSLTTLDSAFSLAKRIVEGKTADITDEVVAYRTAASMIARAVPSFTTPGEREAAKQLAQRLGSEANVLEGFNR